jgi:hypothetical protein
MNHLRASLYQHISAARWRLIDQGFVNVSHCSDGSQQLSVHGSAQFPAIFSFAAGDTIVRHDSWFQWCHTVEGKSVTYALRFSLSSESDAFHDVLMRSSIVCFTRAKEETIQRGGGSDEPTVPLHIHQIIALSHDLQFDP